MRHSMWPSTCTSHLLCFNNRHTAELRGLFKAEHRRTQPCHDPAMSLSLFKLPRVSSHERENHRREAQRQQQPKRGFPSCCARHVKNLPRSLPIQTRPKKVLSGYVTHHASIEHLHQSALASVSTPRLLYLPYIMEHDISFIPRPIPSPCDDGHKIY
jgi:hypothetical protein